MLQQELLALRLDSRGLRSFVEAVAAAAPKSVNHADHHPSEAVWARQSAEAEIESLLTVMGRPKSAPASGRKSKRRSRLSMAGFNDVTNAALKLPLPNPQALAPLQSSLVDATSDVTKAALRAPLELCMEARRPSVPRTADYQMTLPRKTSVSSSGSTRSSVSSSASAEMPDAGPTPIPGLTNNHSSRASSAHSHRAQRSSKKQLTDRKTHVGTPRARATSQGRSLSIYGPKKTGRSAVV